MVLDEITAFLDLPWRVEITAMLRALAHETAYGALPVKARPASAQSKIW